MAGKKLPDCAAGNARRKPCAWGDEALSFAGELGPMLPPIERGFQARKGRLVPVAPS